ncbi:MAG: hypothetical protein IIV19_06635 [Bacteroidaceae bacterium]|nr:hypothetical protein [Bacteroidaceae bacterium]
MKLQYIFPLFFLATLMSCTEYGDFERRLAVADSLMTHEMPDSAYRMLCGMNEEAEHMPDAQRMRHLLLRSNAQNKAYVDFTSDSIGCLLVDYYTAHGTPNERMLAHYIKGCAYRDMGDQPASLRCYNDAVAAADTSRADCNYEQLSIIYGQIADIFDRRAMPDNALQAYEYAERYAWKAKDTIKVFTFWGNKSNALINQGKIQEALRIKEAAAEGFLAMGYPQYAAQIMGPCIKWYARQGEFDKAKAAMDEYENRSGYFLKNGDIESGREDYYHIKGTYYLEKEQLDSAQYFFQKLQTKGKTVNDRYLASWGLSQLYKKLEISDSIAKYAFLNSIQNDSIYNEQNAQNLQHAQAQYDYTRHLETAHRKELEAKGTQLMLYKWIAGSLIAIGIFGILILFQRKQNRRDKQAIEGLSTLIEEKKGVIHSLNRQLEQQAIDIEDYHQKVETIQVLNQKIAAYETGMINRVNANLINQLNKEPAIQAIIRRLNSKDKNTEKQPTHDEWNAVYSVAEKYFPALCDIKANPKISPLEYQICVLTKLRFEIADIVRLTDKDNSFITAKRKRMLPKLFNCTGSAKDFDALILGL